MKKTRGSKQNDPDYIDIFAEDDDISESAPAGSLFDEEDEPVSSAPKKKVKASGGLFSRKKKPEKPSRRVKEEPEEDELYEEEPEEDEEESRPAKKRGLFSRRREDEETLEETGEDDEIEEIETEEEYEPRPVKKHGLFSRREEEESDDWELEMEDEEDGEDEGEKKAGLASRITWSERDEDEEPAPETEKPETKKSETKKSETKKRFSLSALFSTGEQEDEDYPEEEFEEFEESDDRKALAETASGKKHTPVYTAPAVNRDEDWDIGGDFSDAFTETGPETEEEPGAEEKAGEAYEDLSFEEKAESFTFDRYGRRKDKAARTHYGRRKNAKKATTTVITNETDTLREEEEARIRAQKRDIIRDREIEKRREERRVHFLRELKQRLTVAGLLGILMVFVLLAAYFAFRITGIDVSGICTRYSAETIVEKSGLKRGRHILFQDLSAARDRLNDDPYLNASVKYVFPNKINIILTERTGIGVVQWGPNSEFLALIDMNGYVLETDLSTRGSLPVVKGLVVTRVMAGSKIGDDADEQVQSTLDVLRALNEFSLLPSIASVDISETMGISMYTPENYRIELGNVSDLNTKLGRLKKGWRSIMSTAADQMKKPSVDNVTIYLYAKSGVVVSPHGIGYVDEDRLAVSATPSPEPVNPYAVAGEQGVYAAPEAVYYEPAATPEPVDIIPNFNNDPFTG